MQTLLQIVNKKQLFEELQETIVDHCENNLHMHLNGETFKKDLRLSIEQSLIEYQLNGDKFTVIEGTFLFHSIFSEMMPKVYARWYEEEREEIDSENFFVDNKDTKEALKEAKTFYEQWKVVLNEPLLVQELKRAIQYRLNDTRDYLNIKLLDDCDVLYIKPTEGDEVSDELLEVLEDLNEVEEKFNDLIYKLESI